MNEVETQQNVAEPNLIGRYRQITREVHRGFVAEWAVTIILLLFATTTLVQAFVIPSASMEETLLIGDHVLVDKLVYAPQGAVSKHLLPYRDVRRGDVIVFRFPRDITQDYVKRAIGLPGDHIRLVNKQLMLNGHLVNEPYVIHRTPYVDSYRDNFPAAPDASLPPNAIDMLQNHVESGEVVVPPNSIFAMGDNRDDSLDSRYWGFVPRENIFARALYVHLSFDPSAPDLLHKLTGIRWRRIGTAVK
jgi:signal peptidase I